MRDMESVNKKMNMMNMDLGAIVSLDHNYAQVYPIRGLKGGNKETHVTTNHNLWASINSVQPPRRHRTKSYSSLSFSDRMSDPGETMEEDDLIEYYSQWCDKVFSGDHSDATAVILGNNASGNHATTSRSISISNDYTSDSTHRTSPSTTNSDSLNNLNLLASCGTEEQRSREGINNESGSISPSSTAREQCQSGYESPKLENDYQVLAAANALLQLSGNETQIQTTVVELFSKQDSNRKRKSYEVENDSCELMDRNGYQVAALSRQVPASEYYPKNNNKASKMPKVKYTNSEAKVAAVRKPYGYGLQRTEQGQGNKKKKKKRKYKKTGKAAVEDDDSIDSEISFPKITFIPNCVLAQRNDPWGQAIQLPVLTQIFKYVVQSSGPLPSLIRLSKVCKLWYTAAKDPSVWTDIDLSGEKIRKNKRHLIWLCKNRLSMVRSLSLANWEQLTGKELQVLSKHCPKIDTLSLSRCSKLNSGALRGLIENCPDLDSLDISYTSTVITSRYLLEYLVEARGNKLKSLNLATNILVKFDVVMLTIMSKCYLLEVLDLSNVVFSNCLLPLHIESLQVGCPNLRVLLLTNSLFKAKKADIEDDVASAAGFPRLETLSIARSTVTRMSKFRYVNDDVVYRFLKTSVHLKHLDISGCRHVTNRGLQRLVVRNLQSLNISHCSLVNQSDIHETLKKWKHCLISLDLSGNSMEGECLKSLMKDAPFLTALSLTGCRGMPWHLRKDYQKDTIHEIKDALENWNEDWNNDPCLD